MLVTMGFSLSDLNPVNIVKNPLKYVASVAIAPIAAPLMVSAEIARQGVGALQSIRGALKPPAPVGTNSGGTAGGDPSLALVTGVGGFPTSGGGSSSNLPLILGGVAAVGLLVTALVLRGRRP